MLGLTKKQFLKRSKECLEETGNHALLIRELIIHETDGNIKDNEAYNQIKLIIKGIESTFFRYEQLNPPSRCVSIHLKILNCLIVLQESAAANYDYINALIDGQIATEKLEESRILLGKFRKEFRPLTTEIEELLNHKHNK
jgi:hypothetical protein